MIGTANLRIACWYDASRSNYVQMPGCRAGASDYSAEGVGLPRAWMISHPASPRIDT